MFLEQFLSCGSYCWVLGLVNKIVLTKFVCNIWYFATCYIWYTAEPGCMVEKIKYICWNFTRATGKAKNPCLLYLLRPEEKTGFSELARQVTTWAGNCRVQQLSFASLYSHSSSSKLKGSAEILLVAYMAVCSAPFLSQSRSLQTFKCLQKLQSFCIEAIFAPSLFSCLEKTLALVFSPVLFSFSNVLRID